MLGVAVHLSFDHFHAVDVAFDRAAVPGQGQSGGDRVLVSAKTGDEGVQCRLVVLGDRGDSGLEFVAAQLEPSWDRERGVQATSPRWATVSAYMASRSIGVM